MARPSPVPSLEGADAWLNRAEKHLRDLKRIARPLVKLKGEALLASVQVDIETNEHVIPSWRMHDPPLAVPAILTILVGESVQALRRALDYLVFELAHLDSGREQQRTQFPIDESKETFWSRLKRPKHPKRGPAPHLLGIKREHAAVIERSQPYMGVDWAKRLQAISNPDKHMRLVFVQNRSSTKIKPLRVLPRDRLKIGADVRRAPDGFTLIWRLSSSVHVKFQIGAYIAFEDRARVIETLDEIKVQVAGVLAEFRPCFAGQCPH